MSQTSESEQFDPMDDLDEREEDQKRLRTKWEQSETADLVDGCYEHGVGAWKKILNDPKYRFQNRTPVDLKDRFRTHYPQEYKRLYPDAQRVHTPKKPLEIEPPPFDRIQRRQRRPFTQKEDDQLRSGVKKHGVAWSKISRDAELGLSHRKSTDLRDRYRNAFPAEYEALGYSTRPAKKKKSGNFPPIELEDVSQISEDNVDPGQVLEAVVLGGADEDEDEDEQHFWEGPSTSTSQRQHQDSQEAGHETSVPMSRHVETHINPLVTTPVFVESKFSKFSFGQRSPSLRQAPASLANADQLMLTPKVTRVVGARIKPGGKIQYKVRFRTSWAAGDELPPGTEPRLNEFVKALTESISPIRVSTTI